MADDKNRTITLIQLDSDRAIFAEFLTKVKQLGFKERTDFWQNNMGNPAAYFKAHVANDAKVKKLRDKYKVSSFGLESVEASKVARLGILPGTEVRLKEGKKPIGRIVSKFTNEYGYPILLENGSTVRRNMHEFEILNEVSQVEEQQDWDYFYLKNGKIVDEEGYEVFPSAPLFSSVESADLWLAQNNERGNVIGFWNSKSLNEKEYNPWAVCTAKVGRENKDKYERCVRHVKPVKEEIYSVESQADVDEIGPALESVLQNFNIFLYKDPTYEGSDGYGWIISKKSLSFSDLKKIASASTKEIRNYGFVGYDWKEPVYEVIQKFKDELLTFGIYVYQVGLRNMKNFIELIVSDKELTKDEIISTYKRELRKRELRNYRKSESLDEIKQFVNKSFDVSYWDDYKDSEFSPEKNNKGWTASVWRRKADEIIKDVNAIEYHEDEPLTPKDIEAIRKAADAYIAVRGKLYYNVLSAMIFQHGDSSLDENNQQTMKNMQQSGLCVYGKTQGDNNQINEWLKKSDYTAEWNAAEGCFFFVEEESLIDELESTLRAEFEAIGISARFETFLSNDDEALNEDHLNTREEKEAFILQHQQSIPQSFLTGLTVSGGSVEDMLSSLDDSEINHLYNAVEEKIGSNILSETMIPGEIDFSDSPEINTVFVPGTPEYEALEQLDEQDWIYYVEKMASSGITVEYNEAEDIYEVFGSLAGEDEMEDEMEDDSWDPATQDWLDNMDESEQANVTKQPTFDTIDIAVQGVSRPGVQNEYEDPVNDLISPEILNKLEGYFNPVDETLTYNQFSSIEAAKAALTHDTGILSYNKIPYMEHIDDEPELNTPDSIWIELITTEPTTVWSSSGDNDDLTFERYTVEETAVNLVKTIVESKGYILRVFRGSLRESKRSSVYELIVEKNGHKTLITYDDNTKLKPWRIGVKEFQHLQDVLDAIYIPAKKLINETAQRILDKEVIARKQEEQKLNEFAYQTDKLPEAEQQRRLKRGKELFDRFLSEEEIQRGFNR